MTEETYENIHHFIRKSAHFTEYAGLGFLLWRVVNYTPVFEGCLTSYATALVLAAVYASSDEFHQIFVPGRQAAVLDVMLDTTGAAAGLAIVWWVRRLRTKG